MTDARVDAPGKTVAPTETGGRRTRLIHGWSANLVQMLLGLTQQLLLIPAFLQFWSSDQLAAWLAIYAAGGLVVIADAGLQMRAINRFLAFKSCADCDGRTANFYARVLRIYVGVIVALGALLLPCAYLARPSLVLGFQATPWFDAAFIVMTVGMLLTLPSNLVSGLYRTRGKYGRTVWIQNLVLLLGQIAQLVAVATFGNLLAVVIAFVSMQLLFTVFLVAYDAPRRFPFLRRGRRARQQSWRWDIGQFGRGFPFAVANLTELALVNFPVLLVSALVADRVAVAQWGLTRVIASLVRGFCLQAALPLAAELGQDYAIGDRERLRKLYATGSVFVTVLACVIVAGLLPFWHDFFALWTHGSIPYDAPLAITLLLGSAAVAPSLLALSFANHSNRGGLLVRVKGLQFVVFAVLSVGLIRWLGPLGAAIAVVASDVVVQFGILGFAITGTTLRHPVRHTVFLMAVATVIVSSGWFIGSGIASVVPGSSYVHFIGESTIWLIVVGMLASPLLSKQRRDRLIACIPA
ncbi:lipopolysaccharide biosynthesis protein [Bradyrhizobium betae]|uniref:lipopolysaccharide biosynthesis protein n=1 Tax=Bradyrhizobium betae TaxID=244734 RepID=UPI003D680023